MERLTKFIEEIGHYEFICVDEKGFSYCPFARADKLGYLEDIFQKYNINWKALDELFNILISGEFVALRDGKLYKLKVSTDYGDEIKVLIPKEELEK